MLAFMFPLELIASFEPSFLKFYPVYRSNAMAEDFIGLPVWLTTAVYEICYLLQFFSLEWFYRGFMLLVLGEFLGAGAVWVLVPIYVFGHFTRPLGEAIGSFFGGYILGVIAYYTRSIFGGVFIHAGVAAIMEILAFWQLHRQ